MPYRDEYDGPRPCRQKQRRLSHQYWSPDPQDGGQYIERCVRHNHYHEGEPCPFCCEEFGWPDDYDYDPTPEPDHQYPIGPKLPHPTTGNDDMPVPLPF